jgi:hypothetical protein
MVVLVVCRLTSTMSSCHAMPYAPPWSMPPWSMPLSSNDIKFQAVGPAEPSAPCHQCQGGDEYGHCDEDPRAGRGPR